jgi:hypothetical protein
MIQRHTRAPALREVTEHVQRLKMMLIWKMRVQQRHAEADTQQPRHGQHFSCNLEGDEEGVAIHGAAPGCWH